MSIRDLAAESRQPVAGTHPRSIPRAAISAEPVSDTVPPIMHDVLRSPGQPLDAATRAFMEPRFGHDFSRVRIHTDDKAAESTRSINALAYTIGNHIAFDTGQYLPGSASGNHLLAHELTHVTQQTASIGTVASPRIAYPIDHGDIRSEREANDVSTRILTSPVTVHQQSPFGLIQRAAPAAAAVPAAAAGIGRMAAKCIIGAIIGVLIDYGIQAGMHMWRHRTARFWEMSVDVCSLVLSAVLSCIGGAASIRWVEPWLNRALGPGVAGISGPLVGRILMFIANKLTIGVPKGLLKKLMKFGCVSPEQAEAITPGITSENAEEPGSESETEAGGVSG